MADDTAGWRPVDSAFLQVLAGCSDMDSVRGPGREPGTCGCRSSAPGAAQRLQDLGWLGEPPLLELGEHLPAVHGDLEAARVTRNQGEGGDVLLERVEQLVRQTDGLGLVVSHRAVLDRDLHRWRASFQFSRAPNGNVIFQLLLTLTDAPDLRVTYDQKSEPPT